MKKKLKILLAADSYLLLGTGMMIPVYAIFVERIGGDILDASWAWAIFSAVSGILMIIIGKWEDRNKHYERMLFFGFLLRSFAFFGYFFVSNTFQLFGTQILLGISMAMSGPAYDAMYSKNLDHGKFASEWGAWEAMNMIVAAVAAIIGGLIVTYFSFKALFIIMFIIGLIGTFFSFLLLRKPR